MSDEAAIGDNSDPNGRLRSLVDRIERMNEEIKGLQSDRSDIFKEAQSAGFDTKALRAIIRERARDRKEVEEQEHLSATYKLALGME